MDPEKQNQEGKIDNFLNSGNDKETKKPKCTCNSWIGVVLAIIITTVVAGGGVFYFMQQMLESERGKAVEEMKNELQQRLDPEKTEGLKNELRQLQEQLSNKDKLIANEKEKLSFFQKMLSYIRDRNTFKNDEHGVHLTAPKDWKISPSLSRESENDILLFSIIPDEPENCGQLNNKNTCLDKINFGIAQNTENLDFKEYLNKIRNYSDESIKDFEESDFKGKKAYEFVSVSAYDGIENDNFWIELDGGILFFVKGSYLKENQEKDLEEVISSIGF